MTENHLTTRFSCSSASSRSLSMRILSRVGTASRCLVDYWAKIDSFDLKAKVVVPPQHSRDRMLMMAGNWKPRVAKRFGASSLRGVLRKDQVCFCQGVELSHVATSLLLGAKRFQSCRRGELISQYYFTHSLRCIMICIIVWALAYGTVSCQFQFSFSWKVYNYMYIYSMLVR